MSRPVTDATLLKRERADNKRLRIELSASQRSLQAAHKIAARALEDADAWKERFDLLLKRDAKGAPNAS